LAIAELLVIILIIITRLPSNPRPNGDHPHMRAFSYFWLLPVT